jgi:hypothetical protein
MRYLSILLTLSTSWAVLLSVSQIAANLSAAFPPPPAITLSLPLVVVTCRP